MKSSKNFKGIHSHQEKGVCWFFPRINKHIENEGIAIIVGQSQIILASKCIYPPCSREANK
ncbi:MAG: hypothetical protein A2007_04020 [Verrucomicrobia bacterium GWC2_42_7]|nr:MAG: hypothetical protein A2007_04020 [Verrucomicrobia bacterium GWC2_42_7]